MKIPAIASKISKFLEMTKPAKRLSFGDKALYVANQLIKKHEKKSKDIFDTLEEFGVLDPKTAIKASKKKDVNKGALIIDALAEIAAKLDELSAAGSVHNAEFLPEDIESLGKISKLLRDKKKIETFFKAVNDD